MEWGMKLNFPMNLMACVLLLASLTACETNPAQPARPVAAKAELQFVDLAGFDRDLSASLSATLPRIEVAFYDRITPSAVPERLQHWMAAVELGGGGCSSGAPEIICHSQESVSARQLDEQPLVSLKGG